MQKPGTASELIDALGGTHVVAELVGVGPPAVSNWRQQGYIPPRRYFAIAEAGERLGVVVPRELFWQPEAA